MNKFGLTILVLFLGYASSLELMSLDCEGRLSILPSYAASIQLDFSSILGVADTFLDIYKDRLKCLCNDLTDEEFNRLLHPFFGADMAFNIAQGPDADLSFHSRCKWTDFEQVYFRANIWNYFKLNLTDTCSYDTWMRDDKCVAQSQAFSDWDMTFKAAMSRCPNASWRPSVSIICEGKGCDQAFIPCMFILDDIERPSHDDVVSALRTMLIAEDTPSTCIDSSSIITKVANIIRKILKRGSSAYTLAHLQFCSPVKLNFQSGNSTFDWENLIHFTNTSFTSNNNTLTFPGYLQPWNGELMSGGKITPPQVNISKSSNSPVSANGPMLVAEKTCDGKLNVLPQTGVAHAQFEFTWISDVLDLWVTSALSTLKCRFESMGVSISDQELIDRWGLGLSNFFFFTDVEMRDAPVTRGDIRDFRPHFDTRLEYPSSCNYNTWVNSGSCSASYTGLSDLLGTDITVNLEILKCSGSQDISVRVECVGEACSLLTLKSTPCNTDADCPSSLSCKDLGVQFGDFDWIGAYTGIRQYSNNQTSSNQCVASADQIHADTRKLIFSLWNLQYDGSSANKYCTIDYDHVRTQISTWLNGELETTAPGVVRLKNLKSTNEEGKSWAPSISSEFTVPLLVVALLNLIL